MVKTVAVKQYLSGLQPELATIRLARLGSSRLIELLRLQAASKGVGMDTVRTASTAFAGQWPTNHMW